jgi:hypothetical protein
MKKVKNIPKPLRRGPAFVLGLGTKVVPDKKKQQNRDFCRN